MIKVLLTGAKGQLARCILEKSKSIKSLKWFALSFKELDITNTEFLTSFFKRYSFDYLVNCAAYTNVDKAEVDRDIAFRVNKVALSCLAKLCNDYNIILIHISTDFVFDGKKNSLYVEDDQKQAINVYGKSKYQGEQEVIKYVSSYFIIRTSWLYSEYGQNFVKTMLKLAQTNDELNVVVDQWGCPTYARDLASFILMIIESGSCNFGTYHFSNKGVINRFGFALKIFEFMQYKISLIPTFSKDYQRVALRPKYTALDTSKLEKNFKFSIRNWDDSLKDCLKHFKKK